MTCITATVMCAHCAWRAKHVADTALEAGEFLRRLLVEHTVERHSKEQQ